MDKFLVDLDFVLDRLEAEDGTNHSDSVVSSVDTSNTKDVSSSDEKENISQQYKSTSSTSDSLNNKSSNELYLQKSDSFCNDIIIQEDVEDAEMDKEMTEEEEKELEKELEPELKRYQEDSIDNSEPTTAQVDSGDASSLTNQISTSSQSTSEYTSNAISTLTEPTSMESTPQESSTLIASLENESQTANETNDLLTPETSTTISSSFNPNEIFNTNESSTNPEESINDMETRQPNQSDVKPVRPASLVLPNAVQIPGQSEPSAPSPTTVLLNSNPAERDIIPDNVQTSNIRIGHFKPFWIPDEEAPFCMICEAKFTVMKRRHHCRACGKVVCSQCSRAKAPLPYLSYKDARVCNQCLPLLTEDENSQSSLIRPNESMYNQSGFQGGAENTLSPTSVHAPNTPSAINESSAVAGATAFPGSLTTGPGPSTGPSSSVQPVSVLRRASKPRGEPKQVIFSDGIRPGKDLKDDQLSSISLRRHAKKVKSPPVERVPSSPGFTNSNSHSSSNRIIIRDAIGKLPTIVNNPVLSANPSIDNLLTLLANESAPPVTFCLTKNLVALVKLVKLDCCINEVSNPCWTFTSQNLAAVGQDEIIVVLEKLPDENVVPRDVFRLFTHIYDSASKGLPFTELGHVSYPEGVFGNKENSGFLFIRPTFQCLNKIILPAPPFLVGLLIHRFEIPWAKLFPLRLVFRLGAEYNCYPCPIVSYRLRKPSYFEIGHTVMNILADFRNFQYSLPVIPGLTIHMESKKTTVNFPKNRYDKVMKALDSSNEYVLSFGGNFSLTADSHLTCLQNDDAQYHTQTIKLTKESTKVTGASFIVFSGALKPSTGMIGKMSVVEDGLLVQVTTDTIDSLKTSLKEMQDFTVECGKKDESQADETVNLIWSHDDKQFNLGVRSCIDGFSLEGVQSIRMYEGTDYEGARYLIRWVELFLLQNTELPRRTDGYDAERVAEIIAQSFCHALSPYLDSLVEEKMSKIGLRVTLDPEKIGYDVGSNGSPLPANYINRLDAALIPTIMSSVAPNLEVSLVIELIFYILVK